MPPKQPPKQQQQQKVLFVQTDSNLKFVSNLNSAHNNLNSQYQYQEPLANQNGPIKTKNLIGNSVFSESETNIINKSIEDISEG